MKIRSLLFLLIAINFLASTELLAVTEAPSMWNTSMITIWPLLDYRENAARKTSKLSILGPFFTFEHTPDDKISAFRPLYHSENDNHQTRTSAYYLYPLASSEVTPDVTRMEFLQIFQVNTFRKAEPEEKEQQFMLFPLIISGESKKYGRYTSVFPLYGDIYERFWRDEYHYVLFPLYGRTVLKGTTNYNFLWPFFSITSGENESGFRIWPLYGQASKEGVYSSMFILWPFFSKETHGVNGNKVSERLSLFPLYASYDTPYITSRTWLWPFFGYATDTEIQEEERNYLWPLWLTISGKKRNVIRFLPFYSDEVTEDSTKNWYMWPLYETDTLQSPHYRQKRERLLFFLYSNRVESWAQYDKKRQRTTLWPFFLYNRDTDGQATLSIPALIEPIFDREGIEKLWAPLWRLYIHSWNDKGNSSLSILWNLYWHDMNENSTGWELFPFFRSRTAPSFSEVQFLKGLVNFTETGDKRAVSLFWLPFDISWQVNPAPQND